MKLIHTSQHTRLHHVPVPLRIPELAFGMRRHRSLGEQHSRTAGMALELGMLYLHDSTVSQTRRTLEGV